MNEVVNLCETGNPVEQSPLNISLKDKFVLVLTLPVVMRQLSTIEPNITLDPLQFKIFGAVVPPIQVPHNEVGFSGQVYNVSSYVRPNYDPLDVSFVVDNNYKNYWILWKWLSILNDPLQSKYNGNDIKPEDWENRLLSGNLSEYQANFSIYGKNEYNQSIIEFRYHNAFINSLGSINFNYKDSEVMESSVQFRFSQLEVFLKDPIKN
jgi:hypothetical protein